MIFAVSCWVTVVSWCVIFSDAVIMSSKATVSQPKAANEYKKFLNEPQKTLVVVKDIDNELDGIQVQPPAIVLHRCPTYIITDTNWRCIPTNETITIAVLKITPSKREMVTIEAVNHTKCLCNNHSSAIIH